MVGVFHADISVGNAANTFAEFLDVGNKGVSLLGKTTAENLSILKIGLNVSSVGTC